VDLSIEASLEEEGLVLCLVCASAPLLRLVRPTGKH
jgi:hypothetical protein